MFKNIKEKIQSRFLEMTRGNTPLFITDIEKNDLWDLYINSFEDPAEKQSNNCNCCKSFIRNYGHIVSVKDGKLCSIWDVVDDSEYSEGIRLMKEKVLNSSVKAVFISKQKNLGTDKSPDFKNNITWDHFYLELPSSYVNRSSDSVETIMGVYRDNKHVFERSLTEITLDAVDTVLDLINQGSLYRGEEFKNILNEFRSLKVKYDTSKNKDLFPWEYAKSLPQSILRIRNHAIGTLLTNLSTGMDLERAVTAFEKIMAPTNYKRPKEIITKRMIEDAEKTIDELGLRDSLDRRYAVSEDISVNNVFFVDRSVSLKDSIFDELKESSEKVNTKTFDKVEEISVDKFLKDILPTAKSVELFIENSHLSNFATLIAPSVKDAKSMFKWDNNFSWFYTNGVADSIKERVKTAGGNVEGPLRISLAWSNGDDLDLHVYEPNQNHVYYGNRKSFYTGAQLDVDMNAVKSINSKDPVENIIYPDLNRITEGFYKVCVRNFNKRQKSSGFTVQVEFLGELYEFSYPDSPDDKKTIEICEFIYSKTQGFRITGNPKSTVQSKNKWGIDTQKFEKVNMIINSPNHWDDKGVGNRHLFFIIDKAKCDELPRPFFNEFLSEEFMKHKRVFETLGSKLKVQDSDRQLSGLGFSSTQRNSVVLRIDSKFKRLIKIKF